MSNAPSHGTPHGHPGEHAPGADGINLGKIVVIGFASLALFAAGIVWSYQLMIGRQGEIQAQGLARRPQEIGKPEIGIVDQVPFAIDHRLEVWKAANAKHLSSYGWIDRAKGIAHMPIEQAMDQVIAAPPDIPGEGVPPVARPLPPSGVPASSGSKTGGAP